MLKRYSEFISFPIELWTEKTEYETVPDPDAEVAEGEEPKTKSVPKTSKAWEKVNVAKPLWMRSPKEVQADEYDEFYKATFRAYDTPDAHTHFSLEGQVEFRALLYLPSTVPWELSQDMFNDKVSSRSCLGGGGKSNAHCRRRGTGQRLHKQDVGAAADSVSTGPSPPKPPRYCPASASPPHAARCPRLLLARHPPPHAVSSLAGQADQAVREARLHL